MVTSPILKEMKAEPVLARIPVIMMSGQYPEIVQSDSLAVELTRPQSASISETLNYLGALAGALPVRGLPESKAASTSSVVRRARPAF